MAGDTAPSPQEAQALWNDVAKEREAGAEPPSQTELIDSTAKPDPDPVADAPAADDTTQNPAATPAAPETTPAEDPYAGLSPAVRARMEEFDALKGQLAEIPQLRQSVKTAEGRVAAMQRDMDAGRAAAKAAGSTAPSAAQIQAASKVPQEWETLRKEFPEWATATEAYVKSSLAGVAAKQGEGLSPDQVGAIVTRAVEESRVENKYEGWRELINSEPFVEWYRKAPEDIRAKGASDSSKDAIAVLDAYQASLQTATKVAETAAARQAKLAAAASTRPSAVTTPARKTPDQMTPAELWEHERTGAAKRSRSGLIY